jgi:signal peptidase I
MMAMPQVQPQNEEKGNIWLDVYNTLADVVACLIFVTILFVFVIRLVGVVGQSMQPTLYEGDRLTLLSNFLYEPKVGDIVVLKAVNFDDEPIVKRIIADEGQTVDIDFTTGEVWVDGVLLDEPYINNLTTKAEGVQFPITVPENCIFVMGDNRQHSTDSRNPEIGCVDKRYVLGKALQIILPFEHFGGVS